MDGFWRGQGAVVCDPVPVAQDHLAGLLSEMGLEVWTAATLDDALSLVAAKRPPLLLTELVVDHLAGKRVLTTLTERCPDLIIVVCSVLASRAAVTAARAAGAHDFLVKPVRAERLRQALTAVAGRLNGTGAARA